MKFGTACCSMRLIFIAITYSHAERSAKKETSPSAATGRILYEQNFDNAVVGRLPDNWSIISGEWRVEDGALKAETDDILGTGINERFSCNVILNGAKRK